MKTTHKMTRILIVFGIAILACSCGQERLKINHGAVDTTSVVDDRIKDTTRVLASELPVRFDSTDVLLFTIRFIDLEERERYNPGYYSSSGTVSVYSNGDNLVGNFINIIFQDNSGNERKLTDKKILIRKLDFLRDIFRKTKTGYLLYSVTDRDSNGDNELTHSDLEALYISKIDGSAFTKLTKELHDLYDWGLVKGQNKIYFRTLEDQNKDGILNNKDKFHYYFIDLSGDKHSVTEYNPVKVFE